MVRPLALLWRARSSAFRALSARARTRGQGGSPTTAIVDSQSVKSAEKGGRGAIPPAAAPADKGKKRHAIVDTLGLTLGVSITPANVQDRDGFLPLLKEVWHIFVFVERLFADGGYSGDATRAAAKRTRQSGSADRQTLRHVERLRDLAEAVDRGTNFRLARSLSSPHQRLRKSDAHAVRFPQLAMIWLMAGKIAETLANLMNPPDRFHTVARSV